MTTAPTHGNGMPPAQIRCEAGAHYVEGDAFLEVRDGEGIIYRGCYSHLRSALASKAEMQGQVIQQALHAARRVITQRVTYREIDDAVAAIDAALQESPVRMIGPLVA